jgi:tripartite-type tricarboxylate transporter receptor subunit TctC
MPPPLPGRRRLLFAAAAAGGGAALLARLPAGRAQGFPARPVRVVVPYSPGGQSDAVMRLLAPRMQEALGGAQPIVVENRTGAGGTVGAGVVAQAPADGHTLLFESFTFVVVPLVAKGLPFDHETAFVPVAQAVTLPYVLVVKRGFPARDLAGFVAEAKRWPGTVSYGTPGIGSPGHLAGALLESRAGIRLEHIPYRGGQDAARDLIAGNIDAAISTANTLGPLVEDGRAQGIALTSAERRGSLAGRLPSIAEGGYPGFGITSWNGLFAPAGTPAAVVERLNAALRHAARDPEVARRLEQTGNEPVDEDAAAFAARVRQDRETVRRIVAETGMRVE